GTEDEDVRRVEEEEAVLVDELDLRRLRQPLVRGLDAVPEREVTGERPRREPEDEQHDGKAGPAEPAPLRPRLRLLGGPWRAVPPRLRLFLGLAGRTAEGRNLALGAPAAVDAVGLLLVRHPSRW